MAFERAAEAAARAAEQGEIEEEEDTGTVILNYKFHSEIQLFFLQSSFLTFFRAGSQYG